MSRSLGTFEPRVLELGGVDRLCVGRGEDDALEHSDGAALLALADSELSRHHFRVARAGRAWLVRDESSKNGTFLNGKRVARGQLFDGDVVVAGGRAFVFRAGVPRAALAAFAAARRAGELESVSAQMCGVLARLDAIAGSSVPVILRGETGTGKELAARRLHERSGRSGELVVVNCGAIARELVEAELFGVRRGAFSGSTEHRPGLIRRAAGGTLFLDEVAELPLPTQAALLRALESGEVLPVGADRPVTVDFRVVAATNRDLPALVAAGTFRADVYARLDGATVELPALRERREDLGVIVRSLLHRLAGTRAAGLRASSSVVRTLLAHDWPHNVRQLELALATALSLAPGAELVLEHLPDAVRVAEPRSEADPRRQRLVALLTSSGGNVAFVARALGTSRSQVRRLAQRFHLDLDSFRRP